MFDPGSDWGDGMNMDWVGKAIEKVSGLNLEDYTRRAAQPDWRADDRQDHVRRPRRLE